jgi:hypothetical protein
VRLCVCVCFPATLLLHISQQHKQLFEQEKGMVSHWDRFAFLNSSPEVSHGLEGSAGRQRSRQQQQQQQQPGGLQTLPQQQQQNSSHATSAAQSGTQGYVLQTPSLQHTPTLL